MNLTKRIANWLETHWVTPAYSGWLLAGLSLFFFGAATNTLSGWLYVISGVIFALLGIAAILPVRSLRSIQITRLPIEPVSAGNDLIIELVLENSSPEPKTLVQVQDLLPYRLTQPIREARGLKPKDSFEMKTVVENLPTQDGYRWTYYLPTDLRGVYRWQEVQLRTATPLGLFWCRRSRQAPAKAIVYPMVLPLTHCPLVDEIGQEENLQYSSNRHSQASTEGLTRALRPYRWGDPIRLIHWRTSARYGEFRVRELETFTGGQDLAICLDSAATWSTEDFEQAVIAAASLYFYAIRQNSFVNLWTAGTGLVHGDRPVLESLAAVYASEESQAPPPDDRPLVWLTQNPLSLNSLPYGSRWVLWPPSEVTSSGEEMLPTAASGLTIREGEPLHHQLQSPLERS